MELQCAFTDKQLSDIYAYVQSIYDAKPIEFNREPIGPATNFYCLLFAGISRTGKQYAYVGKSCQISKRYARHEAEAMLSKSDTFKCRVWRKYPKPALIVFDMSVDRAHSKPIEQAFMHAVSMAGFELCNSIQAAETNDETTLAGHALTSHKRSVAQLVAQNTELAKETKSRNAKLMHQQNKQRDIDRQKSLWQNADYAKRQSAAIARGLAKTNSKAAMSNSIARAWHDEQKRSNMLNARLATQRTDAYRQKRSIISKFLCKYKTTKVFRYAQTVGRFEPWMHFIIVDGTVTVFVWDTRKVLFQCQETELPEGYVRAKDSYVALQD